MGVIQDLTNELRGYLSLQMAPASPLQGNLINVDEDFLVTIVITNTAPESELPIRFTDLWLRVDSTEFARPTDSDSGRFVVDLPQTTLGPGEFTAVDVTLTATKNMGDKDLIGWFADLTQKERVCLAWLQASVDTSRLFTVLKFKNGYAEIEPT